MVRRRGRTCPLALLPGHEVVAVAIAAAVPELDTLGGEDVVVIA